MRLNKKSEVGDLILNLFRVIPVIIIMTFVLNLFYGRLPEVLENYNEIDFYYLGKRILTTDITTSDFGVIDIDKITEENIRNLFITDEFGACYNITYLKGGGYENEYMCSSEIHSSFYLQFQEFSNLRDSYEYSYFGVVETDNLKSPANIDVIFFDKNV